MQTLSDLIHSFHLHAICEECQRNAQLDINALIKKLGGQTKVKQLRSKLRCSVCKVRTEDIRVVYVGPINKRAIFQYRR
jgi:hypothetical protein